MFYEDENLLAVHKPSGWLVHRSEIDRHETRIVLQAVRDQVGCRVYAPHRLDKGTSGVLLLAKSPDTARRLAAAFENGQVDKHYLAVVRGHPPQAGRIDHPLRLQYDAYEGRAADAPDEKVQTALTLFQRLACIELPVQVDARYPASRYALLAVQPVTGRRHQIRRHLKHIAHPIIGDATYGKGAHNRMIAEHYGAARLLLACTRLTLPHPESGEALCFESAVSADFSRLLAVWGWSAALTAPEI